MAKKPPSPPRVDWWASRGGRPPVGPVSTVLLIEGIRANKVPSDSLVCEVGGTEWKPITGVAAFADALRERQKTRRFDVDTESTMLDVPLLPASTTERPPPLRKFEDADERTIAEPTRFPASDPSPKQRRPNLDDSEEATLLNVVVKKPSVKRKK